MTRRLDPLTKERRAAARRFRVAVPRWRCSICRKLDCKEPRGMAHSMPESLSFSYIFKMPYGFTGPT